MRTQRVIAAQGRSGFTLVELLVVIGIIALLIGILLPALGRARQIAKDTVCASNMRQVTLALMIYANGNNGLLPQADTSAAGNGIAWHVQIWQTVMRTPLSISDITGGGNYSYLAHTPFECPAADQSKSITPSVPPWINVDGYDNSDHRNNGYALNIDLPGTIPNSWSTPASIESPQIVESKRLTAVRHASEALLLADSKAYYIEYYDRGDSLLYMDAGFGDGGGLHRAWGRHGRWRDAWNVGYCDGSVRMMRFADLPGIPTTPTDYYLVALRLNPSQLLSHTDVPSLTKRFWLGQDQ